MISQYVECFGDGYRVAGSRVSLDSIVYAYWNGQTAESIAQSFPSVSLEQVHGALAFYLAHRGQIDEHLDRVLAEFDALRDESRRRDPMFFQRLAESRRAEQATRP